MNTIKQVVEAIRARNITLEVRGEMIHSDGGRIAPRERAFLRQNRADAIEYLQANSGQEGVIMTTLSTVEPTPEATESPCCARARAAGYEAGHAVGYGEGIQHAVAELQVNPQPAAPAPARLPVLTPEGEVAKFKAWQHDRSAYYWWEPICMDQLRAALQPGDRIRPLYAYSCMIVHADGFEEEFERKPPRK